MNLHDVHQLCSQYHFNFSEVFEFHQLNSTLLIIKMHKIIFQLYKFIGNLRIFLILNLFLYNV